MIFCVNKSIFLVPPCFGMVRIANLNSEAILASPNYVCGREMKFLTCTLARLVSPGGPWRGMAKYASARRLHEWSVKIQLLALQERGFLLLFYFLVTWTIKVTRYGRSNQFPNLITNLITTQGLLHPECRRALANGRAGLRNLHPRDPAPGEED